MNISELIEKLQAVEDKEMLVVVDVDHGQTMMELSGAEEGLVLKGGWKKSSERIWNIGWRLLRYSCSGPSY